MKYILDLSIEIVCEVAAIEITGYLIINNVYTRLFWVHPLDDVNNVELNNNNRQNFGTIFKRIFRNTFLFTLSYLWINVVFWRGNTTVNAINNLIDVIVNGLENKHYISSIFYLRLYASRLLFWVI